jgi:hypothetical protein
MPNSGRVESLADYQEMYHDDCFFFGSTVPPFRWFRPF